MNTMWVQDVILCLVLLHVTPSRCKSSESLTNDAYDHSPTPDMIRKAGYPCEVHHVMTEDGYILTVHRIPGGHENSLNSDLAPVFLQHGLLDSSADFVLNGPGKGLGYKLADQGYDVWLGNARGNVYSKAHKTVPTHDHHFWDWTWHEMGYYDLPAVLDYVLEVTGHSQLHYVGHSMGTTMFFVLCTTRPEYNAKIRSMTALAPVVFMGHAKSPVKYLARYSNRIERVAKFLGAGQFLPRHTYLDKLMKYGCKMSNFQKKICENYLFLMCGYDPEQFDEKLLPVILGHNPSGESTKTILHYGQEISSKLFQQYDYGPIHNKLLYNSYSPPQYNLSLVTAPVALIYADNDLLANPKDVKKLFRSLINPVGLFRVDHTAFNHLDFLWGKDAGTLVYNQLNYLLKVFSDGSVRCVKPKDRHVNGVVEVEPQPCSSRLVEQTLEEDEDEDEDEDKDEDEDEDADEDK